MKPEDAIKELESAKTLLEAFANERGYTFATQEPIDMAIGLLEREIPKKPVFEGDGKYEPALCPRCGEWLSKHYGDGYFVHNTNLDRCPDDDCMQRLDWEGIH